ncbi:MAG: hypothetical protein ISS36_02540 [Candidatus Aenigmarchaeota archaeon]|nr:hypothetical protein [Candidatus Aenigmarchaeota archaeon]
MPNYLKQVSDALDEIEAAASRLTSGVGSLKGYLQELGAEYTELNGMKERLTKLSTELSMELAEIPADSPKRPVIPEAETADISERTADIPDGAVEYKGNPAYTGEHIRTRLGINAASLAWLTMKKQVRKLGNDGKHTYYDVEDVDKLAGESVDYEGESVYTGEQVRSKLGIGAGALAHMSKTGKIKKLGNRGRDVLYSTKEVDDLVAE